MILTQKQIDRSKEIYIDCDGFESYLDERAFSEEELENINGLCDVLQDIRARLVSEGFSIEELRDKFHAMQSGILLSTSHAKK